MVLPSIKRAQLITIVLSLCIIGVTFAEVFYWAYKTARLDSLNVLSYAITAITIFVMVLAVANWSTRTISLRKGLDRGFVILSSYLVLLTLFGLLSSPSDAVTILVNPFTFPSIATFAFGYIAGRQILRYRLENNIRTAIRIILCVGIIASFLRLVIPSLNLILSTGFARLFYILLLYIVCSPRRFDYFLIIVGLYCFIATSATADIRTNYVFLFLMFGLQALSYVFKISSSTRRVIFSAGIVGAIIFSFYSDEMLSLFAELFSDSRSISTSNTRTFLFEELFASYDSLISFEFIFGRGLMGTYYSDYFFQIFGTEYQGDYYRRFTIEVGFLEIILKFGLVSLALFLYLIIAAIFKKTNRDNSVLLSIAVYALFILMFVEFYPAFSTRFLLFWILIGYMTPTLNTKRRKSELIGEPYHQV